METFSVVQWFPNETYEYYVRGVSHIEAMYHFGFLTNNVAARTLKITQAVRIIDEGDCVVVEWIQGKGVTFPPEMVGKPTTPLLNLRKPDGTFMTEDEI